MMDEYDSPYFSVGKVRKGLYAWATFLSWGNPADPPLGTEATEEDAIAAARKVVGDGARRDMNGLAVELHRRSRRKNQEHIAALPDDFLWERHADSEIGRAFWTAHLVTKRTEKFVWVTRDAAERARYLATAGHEVPLVRLDLRSLVHEGHVYSRATYQDFYSPRTKADREEMDRKARVEMRHRHAVSTMARLRIEAERRDDLEFIEVEPGIRKMRGFDIYVVDPGEGQRARIKVLQDRLNTQWHMSGAITEDDVRERLLDRLSHDETPTRPEIIAL